MIELLERRHNRTLFDCGTPELNDYLQKRAMQHAKSGASRTFVLINKEDRIAGFYSLSMGSIDKKQLPKNLQNRFPNHPLAVARLGRLAVDKQFQGKGVGKHLLAHALKRCYLLSKEIGMTAVVLDAKNEKVKQFYLQFEFETLPDQPLLLWLPIKALKKLFE